MILIIASTLSITSAESMQTFLFFTEKDQNMHCVQPRVHEECLADLGVIAMYYSCLKIVVDDVCLASKIIYKDFSFS